MNTGLAVAAFAIASFPAFASTSPKEAEIRDAYARAGYSTELHSVNQAVSTKLLEHGPIVITASEIQAARNGGSARLTVSNFRLMSRAELGEAGFRALKIEATPEVLLLGGSSSAVGDIHGTTAEHEFDPVWSTAQNGWKMDASRYNWVKEIATYTVTASFQGTTRTASAYAFFGESQAEIEDTLVGSMNNLARDVDAYPKLLLRVGSYDAPAVRDYLQSSQVDSGCCGPLASDVRKRMAQPLGTSDPELHHGTRLSAFSSGATKD